MRSTFHGLETSKRALFTQRTGMNTTGHNISNANTEGYSRQRVNMSATNAIEWPSLYKSTAPGQIGTGVKYDSVERIRDDFLDLQYRRENQTFGEWSVREQTNLTIETILNEPSESGLRSVMDQFWDSWETLNRDPSLLSARGDVRGQAINLVDTFNHVGKALQDLENDIATNIQMKTSEANNLIESIAQVTEKIKQIEALGDHANDLRDKRDLLVDKLSRIIDVNVTETPNNDYIIVSAGVEVVNNNNVTLLTVNNAENAVSGELAGYVKSRDIDVATIRNQLNAMVNTWITGDVKVTLPEGYIAARDLVAQHDVTLSDGTVIVAGDPIPAGSTLGQSAEIVVQGFNGLHELGYSMEDPPQSGIPFFINDGGDFTIDNIRVNPQILNDTNKIAASGQYEVVTDASGNPENRVIRGNSDIAHALAGLRDQAFDFSGQLTSFSSGTTDDYFRAMTGEFGVRSYNATRNKENQEDLIDAIDIRRKSVSGVSLDEEMADLIRFQHAYNAAARNMTAVDEMLDRIINGTGKVGR